MPVEEDVKPPLIKQHGTKVVLLGSAKDSNTMIAPVEASSPSRWISKYLNTRYFQFPTGITIKAREGWDYQREDKAHNMLRVLTGQAPYLKQHSASNGNLKLTNANAYWWILKDEHSLLSNNGYIEATGHIAALYHDELYELTTGRAGMARLQQFGITFGYKQVVIYVEPLNTSDLTTNTARTTLLIKSEHLPWTEWASEFRNNIPEEIAKLIAEKAAATSNTDHQKAIRERLKDIIRLFKLSRYLPDKDGKHNIDEDKLLLGSANTGIKGSNKSSKLHATAGPTGNVYAVFEKVDGPSAKNVKPDPFPEVRWISIKNKTREPGDIEDRAARFLIEQNLLLINEDFPAINDMINFFANDFAGLPGIGDLIQDISKGWYEQAFVETVIGVQSLLNRKDWTQADIDKALSEEALTTAIMQRYHIYLAVKREVASKVGTRKIA